MKTSLERLYLLKIPEIQQLFIDSIQNVVDDAQIEEMIEAIENNDIDALYEASGFTPVYLNRFIDSIEDIYETAGTMTVENWPKRLRAVFNIRNEAVERDLKTYSSNFVSNITDEVKDNLRQILAEGEARGYNPRKTALDIVGRVNSSTMKREGGILGLSSNQTKWVINARRYLENLDKRYFDLTLRDKRFDSIVKKAIENGKKLTNSDIERLITAYEKKALKWRADAIARTEVMQSINRAEYASLAQNIENGKIKKEAVTKWWSDTHDSRTRLSHVALGLKYNEDNQIPFDEPFVTNTGSKLMYPGDTSLGADLREIIHCRCKAEYNVDFLAEFS